MVNALKKLRESKGLSQTALATAMGTTRSQYVKLERGERRLSQDWIERAATALGVSPAAILGSRNDTVPLVGVIGAGGTIYPIDDHEQGAGLEEVEVPPGAGPSTVAAEVRGDSMPGIAEEGWFIYWDERQSAPDDRHIGKLCVVGLNDGRVLVKKIYRSKAPGLFTLFSTGADPIMDVVIEWAAKVSFIKPR